MVGQIWNETNSEIICNGFKKSGIFPYNQNVISKEQYDPLACKRWEDHQQDNNVSNFPTDNVEVDLQPQPGPSGINDKNNCSFQELLLSTVKQTEAPGKTKKTKLCSGAEVITEEEVIRRIS